MTEPSPPPADPLVAVLGEIRDVLLEIRDAVKPSTIEQKMPAAVPMRIDEPRRPPPARSGRG